MEQLVAGAIRNEAEIVARLERCARLDPRLLRAIGGYELEPPIFDLTWTFRAVGARSAAGARYRRETGGRPMNAYVRSALSRVRRHPGSPERRTRDDPASRGLFDRRAHRSSLERERSLRRSSCGRQSDADLWRAVAEYRAQAQVFAEARHGEAVDA